MLTTPRYLYFTNLIELFALTISNPLCFQPYTAAVVSVIFLIVFTALIVYFRNLFTVFPWDQHIEALHASLHMTSNSVRIGYMCIATRQG
jgi:hypothetical protein